MTLCSPAGDYQHFRRTLCFHFRVDAVRARMCWVYIVKVMKSSPNHSGPGDWGSTFLWNIGIHLWNYTVLQPRKLQSKNTHLWKPENVFLQWIHLSLFFSQNSIFLKTLAYKEWYNKEKLTAYQKTLPLEQNNGNKRVERKSRTMWVTWKHNFFKYIFISILIML